MTDVFTREKRSSIMRRVKCADTKPELRVRRWLHARGFRFRLHRKDLPGKPDIVLPGRGAVVFVHGCFWHGHSGCKRSALPTSNHDYWAEKISRNILRDRRNAAKLRRMGWRVLTIWECEVGKQSLLRRRLEAPLRRAER